MFSFVILHYKNTKDTIECLQSIKDTFNKKDYNIVVVDNHTLQTEEIAPIKEFTKHIILLEENVGFAKANNIGCTYAIEHFKSDFLVVINNDVLITQPDFFDIIQDTYNKYQFDLLGPWIDSPTNESCNPFPVIYGKQKVQKRIAYYKNLIHIYKSPLRYILLEGYIFVKRLFKKTKRIENGTTLQQHIALHGCAIIFSKKYYTKYDTVFYDETFLFHEEEFLYNRICKDDLVSVYNPNLKVFHKEGSSLKGSIKKERSRKLFKTEEKLKSMELLLKEM